MSIYGVIFGTTISFMILFAINASQYVIIRIPKGMKIFEEEMKHSTSLGLRKMLTKKISDEPKQAHLQPLLDKLHDADRTDEKFRF
jgi:hypothetical protein